MPLQPPRLPENISSDGHEIWDWATNVGKSLHRSIKIRDLKSDIAGLKNKCGSCGKWMKTGICPREKNINGYSRGPSINGSICSEYEIEERVAYLIQKKEIELAELLKGGM